MKYQDMLAYVTKTTGVDQDRAETVTRAFLETLATRLPNDEAKDLAAQLPTALKEALHPTAPEVEKIGPDEFLTRFARLANISNQQAPDMAKAVWQSLEQAVSQGELDEVVSVLPEDLVLVLR